MKKNKLYTANKWNRPVFMPEPNIFAGGGWTGLAQADKKANPWNYADDVDTTQQYMQSKNAFGISKADNPFSKGNLTGAFSKESLSNTVQGAAPALLNIGANLVGGLANSAISGGLESGAGSAISGIGSQVGGAIGSVNPVLGAAVSVGSQVLGGVTNALFGEKVDQAKLKAANESMSSLRSFNGNVGSFDDIKGPEATASVAGTYKGGLFNSSAKRKQKALEEAMIDARQYAGRAIANNVSNLADDQISNALANFSAFGGPLDMGGGALDYGLAMDYLTMKKQQNEAKNRVPGISPMPAINTFGHGGCFNPFALGGDVQMHGADFTNGLISINAGGSHETNPNEGVQLGVDPEGTPNLVEEGETVFDDYVYSNRILADAQTKEKFGLPRKKDITFADISKKLEKESSERPNDPISQAGLKAQMHQLADEQERQKQEMDAQRAKVAFEALSPEEQVAVMENAAQQEAMAEQAAMQQPSPEEIAMAQQQMQADGSQAALGQEAQPMMAEGGHLLKKGGYKWDSFWEPTNEYSKKAGNAKNKYAIDKTYKGNIKDLENSEAYKAFTNYILNEATDEERQKYFEWIDKNTGRSNKYLTDGKLVDNWKDMFQAARTDGLYGIQHYTPDWEEIAEEEAAATEKPVQVYIAGENSLTPVDESTLDDSYTIEDFDGVKIARKKAAKEAPAKATTNPEGDKDLEDTPKHRAEWPRYAGLFGPAVGLGMMAAGIGKPDKGSIDAAISGTGDVALASYQPLGNYLTYRPMDIWYEQNRMNANARATDRAILNSGANQGAKMAGLLASGYNNQIASGDLYRKALEYNDALRERVATFNRGTDQWNSGQFGETSRFNASARNQANQHASQLRLQAAREKADMDAGWYNSLYGNVAGLFKGLGDLGRENAQWNMIADAGADGVFGNLGTSNTGHRVIKQKTKKCKGGKLNKRRGLTF